MSTLHEAVYSARYGRKLLIHRWSDAEIGQVRVMAAEGFSSTEIGAGLGVTRNMIIGVCQRNGIVLDAKNQHRLARGPRRTLAPRAPTPVPEPEPDVEIGKPFLDLAPHECRYPLGELLEPSEFFCGAPAQITRPYCRTHCALAYRRA